MRTLHRQNECINIGHKEQKYAAWSYLISMSRYQKELQLPVTYRRLQLGYRPCPSHRRWHDNGWTYTLLSRGVLCFPLHLSYLSYLISIYLPCYLFCTLSTYNLSSLSLSLSLSIILSIYLLNSYKSSPLINKIIVHYNTNENNNNIQSRILECWSTQCKARGFIGGRYSYFFGLINFSRDKRNWIS